MHNTGCLRRTFTNRVATISLGSKVTMIPSLPAESMKNFFLFSTSKILGDYVLWWNNNLFWIIWLYYLCYFFHWRDSEVFIPTKQVGWLKQQTFLLVLQAGNFEIRMVGFWWGATSWVPQFFQVVERKKMRREEGKGWYFGENRGEKAETEEKGVRS